MAAIKLLTAAHMEAFKRLGRQRGDDAKVVVKFFNPLGAATWYFTEFDPETGIGYGFATLGDPECAERGYTSLYELANIRRRKQFSLDEPEKNPPLTEIKVGGADCPLGIERDLHFPIGSMTIGDVIKTVKSGGHV
jgi:hypothetical protein